jgi:mono/diheme cytochrome c family protein
MRRTEAASDTDSGPAGWAGILVAIAMVVVALAVVIPLYAYLASEALIQQRYPLTSTTAHAELKPKQILRGTHLIAISGCADCHGASLQGRLMHANASLPVYAGNLLRDVQEMSDGEIERAIRYAIKPDATSMWIMPSGSYAYMSEDDVGAIISALRAMPPAGDVRPAPKFGWPARWHLLTHVLRPAVLSAIDAPASLDLGPRYDGGRYLARITCGECHGTDLKGAGYAPSLATTSRYNRAAFFSLLREGRGANGRTLPAMYRLAHVRFHVFADYEIMALYDYLDARAHAPAELVARAEALRKHQEDEKRLNDSDQ